MRMVSFPAAVATLILVPAGAQAQLNVTLFGNAGVQVESVKATGSVTPTGAASPSTDKPSRWRVTNVSSDLGIRATKPLGNTGLTGIAQYITLVNVDNANGGTASGIWGSAKDTFVGVSHASAGTLKLGRVTGAARWIAGTADFSPIASGPQDDQAPIAGFSGLAAPAFNIRMDNTVGFETVSFSGFSARAYYGANEGKSNSTVNPALNDSIVSLGLNYVIGPADVRLAYEVRNDKGTLNASTANDTKDTDLRVGMRYTLPTNTVVGVLFDRMKLRDNTATAATATNRRELERKGWLLGARHPFGDHAIYTGFGKAGNLSGLLASGARFDGSQTGVKQFVLGYTYTIDKGFLVETYFSQVANEKRAKYDFDSAGITPGTGAKLTAFGAGLRYSF